MLFLTMPLLLMSRYVIYPIESTNPELVRPVGISHTYIDAVRSARPYTRGISRTNRAFIEMTWKEHDDVIKWKHFPRYWPFVREIHRSPVNSPHKGQWRGALMFSLICAWINGWVNNREAGDLRRYRAHYDVSVMKKKKNPPRLYAPLYWTHYGPVMP